MIPRLFTHKMLSPGDLEPSDPRMRVVGVFNPGVAEVGGRTAVLARVVEQPVEERAGYLPSPRYGPDGLQVDWLDLQDCDTSDPRTLVSKSTGLVRLRFVSHLRLFWSDDGRAINTPVAEALRLMPEGAYECFGVEDPRVTRIDGVYYTTYAAVSPEGICTSLLATTDFAVWERRGVVLPPDNKDVLLFPEAVGGRYTMLHRPMPNMRFAPPQMWIAQSDDLQAWGDHRRLRGVEASGAGRDRVGGSTPPVLTDRGWLTLYHGSDKLPGVPGAAGGGGAGVYTAGALLLDRDDPSRVIARSPGPVMRPEADFERRGFVDNVVFPTGAVVRGDRLDVYYGAADEHTAVCGFSLDALLDACDPVS